MPKSELLLISEVMNLILLTLCLFFSIKLLRIKQKFNALKKDFDGLVDKVVGDKEQKRETSRRRYVSREMREYILKRDNYTCQICGISRGYLDQFAPGLGDYLLLDIDHIVPVAAGGSGQSDTNLQTLCWRCNNKKSNKRTNEQTKSVISYGIDKLKSPFIEGDPSDAVSISSDSTPFEADNNQKG